MDDPRKAIFAAVRDQAPARTFNDPAKIKLLDDALDALGVGRAGAAPAAVATSSKDPPWLAVARPLIGTKEIVGPRHNSWIVESWRRLGASWFNDDETPWCGLFAAHCVDAAGLAIPGGGLFPRAKAWADWGKPCDLLLGAIVVFGRNGGGHVGFLVGQSATHLYVLGGNQSNEVNISPIAKGRLLAARWPVERPMGTVRAPQMTGGTVSRNEQ